MRRTLPAVAVSAAVLTAIPAGAAASEPPAANADATAAADSNDLAPPSAEAPASSPQPAVPEGDPEPPAPAPEPVSQQPATPVSSPPPSTEDNTHQSPGREPQPDPAPPTRKPHPRPDPAPSPPVSKPKRPPRTTPRPPLTPSEPPKAAPVKPVVPKHSAPSATAPESSAPPPASAPVAVRGLRVPLFLLPIYRAAEARYGVPWQVLAAINEIESDFGRNARVSSAGAVGWMQFMPPTWRQYGVDRNRDGKRDPYNPIDATFAAARYLSAAGAPGDLRSALFAYNHADWYVKDVLSRARRIERTTSPLLDALTGLAYARFPVPTPAAWRPTGGGRRRGVAIHTAPGSPVLAVNDGVIVGMGRSRSLGRYIVLEDLQGNRFTYARLGWVAERHGVIADTRPNGRESVDPRKVRLFAHPARRRALAAGGLEQLIESGAPVPGYASFDKGRHGMGRHASKMRPLRIGSRVAAGTVLGRVGGARPNGMGRIRFEIRPVGPGAPLIDPEAVLDAWQRLDAAGAFRPSGASTLGGMQGGPSLRPALMVPLRLLQRKVLADPRITIYPCGRADVAAGRIDRRVLVTLEFLAASNLRPTVTSLECGHGRLTASGNVSEHTSGDAVDIASINGIPILGHQGTNSITDVTVRRLLTLKGAMEPHQIISLMTFKGSDNTLAMSDHANHIHVGFRPRRHPAAPTPDAFAPELSRRDWVKLSAQLASIPNPAVPVPATLRRVAHTKRPGR